VEAESKVASESEWEFKAAYEAEAKSMTESAVVDEYSVLVKFLAVVGLGSVLFHVSSHCRNKNVYTEIDTQNEI